jgi:hypothetical protein
MGRKATFTPAVASLQAAASDCWREFSPVEKKKVRGVPRGEDSLLEQVSAADKKTRT